MTPEECRLCTPTVPCVHHESRTDRIKLTGPPSTPMPEWLARAVEDAARARARHVDTELVTVVTRLTELTVEQDTWPLMVSLSDGWPELYELLTRLRAVSVAFAAAPTLGPVVDT